MISKAIYEDCRRRNKNLSMAWIDYQKAFDSVPHSWVEKSIELGGVFKLSSCKAVCRGRYFPSLSFCCD
jgi:hypothetical protein